MMGRATSLEPDQAWRQPLEERHEVPPSNGFGQQDAAGAVDHVNLEDLLRQIEANRDGLGQITNGSMHW
jgi:hypothetical protein